MYDISAEDYGLHCRIWGVLTFKDAAAVFYELEVAANDFGEGFSLLLDRRELAELGDGTTAYILKAYARANALGLKRVAVAPPAGPDRFHRIATKIARLAGLAKRLRYFDAADPDWEEKARTWLLEEEQPRRRSQRWSFAQMLIAA